VHRQLGLIEFELKLFRIELLPINQGILIQTFTFKSC
jgi:hypothetical protein